MSINAYVSPITPGLTWLLGVSLIPFVLKLVSLLIIGSYIAAAVSVAVLLPLLYGFLGKPQRLSESLRYWAFMLISYGVLRSVMHLLVLTAGNGVESSIWYQFTVFFHLKNAGLVVLGLLIRRQTNGIGR